MLDLKASSVNPSPIQLFKNFRHIDFASPLFTSDFAVVLASDILGFVKGVGVLSALRQRASAKVFTHIFVPAIEALTTEQSLGISILREHISPRWSNEPYERSFSIHVFYPKPLTASQFIFTDGKVLYVAIPSMHDDPVDEISPGCVCYPTDTSSDLIGDIINIPLTTRCDGNLLLKWSKDSAS